MSPSKGVNRQLLGTIKVASSALEQAEPIAAVLEKELAPYGTEGEPKVEWGQLQKLLGRRLMASGDSHKTADDNLEAASFDGAQIRRQRKEAVEQLRRELRRVRFLLDETLPKEEAYELFPQRGRLGAIEPLRLARIGRRVAEVLRKSETQARVQNEAGNLPQPAALAQTVDAAAEKLEQVLEAQAPRERQHEISFDRRKQERAEVIESWRRTRDLLRGIYRMAGFDYMAEQLRDRRRKKAEEGEGEAEAMAGAKPTEAKPAAAPAAEVPLS